MGIFDELSDWFHDLIDGPGGKPSLADLGADPDQVTPAFPNAGGSSVMDQVNQSMETATQAYHEGMEIAEEAPQMPSAGAQAQGIIDGVMSASPEQLEHMAGTVEGLNAGDEIRNSVAESHQALLDDNALHEQLRAADQEEIHAKAVEAAARDAAARAEDAL